jgi:hypothetical protein
VTKAELAWCAGFLYRVAKIWIFATTVSLRFNTTVPFGISGTYVNPLPAIMESPSAELSDLEWLDAQVEEVCALAE